MKYFFPFIYFFNSRAKTILHKGSFFILILFSVMWAYYRALETRTVTFIDVAVFVLGFLGMFCLYEVGYLFNDVITTRNEANPSYWVSAETQTFVEKYFEMLVTVRICLSVVCGIVISKIRPEVETQYFLCVIGLLLSYAFHNTLRNRWNVVTNCFLQVFKYNMLLLLVAPFSEIKIYFFINLFTVPVLRTIEFCNKERLNIHLFRRFNVNRLRIVYHIAMVIIGSALYFCGIKECLFLAEISVVLFAYRCIGELLLKNKNISDIRKKNFDKVK